MERAISKKLNRFFKICNVFLIFEKGDKQKIRRGFLQFASKYTFSKCLKGHKGKIGPGFLRFVSIVFLNIWKKDKQKIGPGFLGFGSILF